MAFPPFVLAESAAANCPEEGCGLAQPSCAARLHPAHVPQSHRGVGSHAMASSPRLTMHFSEDRKGFHFFKRYLNGLVVVFFAFSLYFDPTFSRDFVINCEGKSTVYSRPQLAMTVLYLTILSKYDDLRNHRFSDKI